MLVAGATFEEAADYFSIPKQSLGSFEIIKGQAYKEFEDVAFTLNDGEISEPFESPAGFHIVKRFSSRPFGVFEKYHPACIDILSL